jgi:hypothetical protein
MPGQGMTVDTDGVWHVCFLSEEFLGSELAMFVSGHWLEHGKTFLSYNPAFYSVTMNKLGIIDQTPT